ncbi:MAG: class E sortase [Actinobacteria bacterium]|nr:class E sortase [Actinomycetota bacterium]
MNGSDSEASATDSPPPPGVGGLVSFLRKRGWARRLLSGLSVLLLLGAVGMLGYPFYTNLYQNRVQDKLDSQLASPEIKQAYRDRAVKTGDSLTRIKIPAIDVDVVVVEGTTASALKAGAGHYPSTPLPCETGNVGIAGHRTTYGRPFHNLDRLKPGDEIILETPLGRCSYKVDRDPFVVAPTDLSVVDPTDTATLTLTTCEPKGSAARRLVVKAVFQGAVTQA